MSDAQLSLPSLSEDENTAVERFMERATDIVPTLQVTLAKRIMRPGSNKVLCMAARTSVPLNDDEAASVSDLALRLSDGTNVVLSLSFFNDPMGAGCIPFSRSIFEPNRYTIQNESRLGFIILAILLISSAGFYSMATRSFSAKMWPQNWSNTAYTSLDSPPSRTTPLHNTFRQKAKITKQHASLLKNDVQSTSGSFNKSAATSNGTTAKSRSGTTRFKVLRTKQSFNDTMFVPPPPVTYTLPYVFPSPAFEPVQTNAPLKPIAKHNVANQPPASSTASMAPTNIERDFPTAKVNDDITLNKKAQTTASSTSPELLKHPAADSNELERIPFATEIGRTGAPLPGNFANSSSLEHIDLPNSMPH